MATQVKYIPLSGGLNLIDSPITMTDGALVECNNFEQVFGQQGYSRIAGYERYDGQPQPHLGADASAVAARRAVITTVPGEGPIRGVAVYKDYIVAARNAVGGATAAVYKSSGSGWTSIKTGLTPDGDFRFIQANFSGSSSTIYLFWVDGKNDPYRFDGTTATAITSGLSGFGTNKAFDLCAHKDHLFLLYPQGQLQTSNLGDPMACTTTAALFGLGDDLTNMISIKGSNAAIYCANKTMLLSGSDKTSWQMSVNSLSSGARRKTSQEIGGAVIALDDRGLTSLQATQSYGSFEMSIFSRNIQPYVPRMLSATVDSCVIRSKGQFRFYTSNKEVIVGTVLTPNAQVMPNDISFTRCQYQHVPTCSFSGEMSGEEYIVFGTADGYVMREGVGTSFDGAAIQATLRLPFSSYKSPSQKKRFRKITAETSAGTDVIIKFKQMFDYDDGTYRPSIPYSASGHTGGGVWDASEWDSFKWSTPIQGSAEVNVDGVGRNMGMLIWSESAADAAYNIQGLIVHYSPMGISR